MKRITVLAFVILLPLLTNARLNVEKEVINYEGLRYEIDYTSKTATVKSNNYSYQGTIIIPEKIVYKEEPYTVTSIGAYAFRWCEYLTSVTIPNSVTIIEEYAFEECTRLTSISIPNSVTIIANDAFSGCSNLTSVTIPNSVTTIGSEAFQFCGLTSVTIPNSVTSIGGYAFYYCSLTSVTIPNSVTSIANGTFSNSSLTSVTIPNSVTSIGGQAFSGCSGLTSITIPNSVTSIGPNAFQYCRGLTSVIIPNSVTELGNYAFSVCINLSSVTISNSLTTIGYGTFESCYSLTSVTIPNSVTTIGSYAFRRCDSLASITIPNSVTYIDRSAFWGCSGLKDVYCLGEDAPQTPSPLFPADNSYSPFPENDVKNATLHVMDYAIESFKGVEPWSYFKEIVCDEKITDFTLTYYVDGDIYKQYKHKYDDVITPEAFPNKKGYTFSGWSAIPEKMPGKDVDVNGTFTLSEKTIDGVVYKVVDCENDYAAVVGHDNVCRNVKIVPMVEIDEYSYTITEIADSAFYGRKKIRTIEIPATVTNVGERAFAGIDKLTDVTCLAVDVPQTDRTAFENSYIDYVKLHVPAESEGLYGNVGPWSGFKSIVPIAGATSEHSEKCATPTISYVNGKLTFSCETDGAEFVSEITDADIKKSYASEVDLTVTYNISVYATKVGYDNSDKVRAVLCWIDVTPEGESVVVGKSEVRANPVLIKSNGSMLTIEGVNKGTPISVYDTAGRLVGSAMVSSNVTNIDTSLDSGDVGIVRIGESSLKVLMK